eukprot:7877732-Pyramimonas_sp.AAC.1
MSRSPPPSAPPFCPTIGVAGRRSMPSPVPCRRLLAGVACRCVGRRTQLMRPAPHEDARALGADREVGCA